MSSVLSLSSKFIGTQLSCKGGGAKLILLHNQNAEAPQKLIPEELPAAGGHPIGHMASQLQDSGQQTLRV